MDNDVKVIFEWATQIGDSNITNRILAKVMPNLVEEKMTLTDLMIKESDEVLVSKKLFDAIKASAETLLGVEYK